MSRLKEKSGNFGNHLNMLYKGESAPDGPHSRNVTVSAAELQEAVTVNRPHITSSRNSNEPPDLSGDKLRFIERFESQTKEPGNFEKSDLHTFLNQVANPSNSGPGVDRVPNAVYRVNLSLFARMLV